MSLKLQHRSLFSSSSSGQWLSAKAAGNHSLNNRVVSLDHLPFYGHYRKKRCRIRLSLLEHDDFSLGCRFPGSGKQYVNVFKSRIRKRLLPSLASADDGVTVNGSPRASTSGDVENMRVKLDQSFQGEDYSTGLVQSLHDAARVLELAIREKCLSKLSWFSTTWLGVDKNAWIKALSYQASVYSLLQAAREVSSRGDGRDKDIHVFVQRSLARQSASLESVITEKLSTKQPEAYEWFWSDQIPATVTSFVNYFEKNQSFGAATGVCGKGQSSASDVSLLMLALNCLSAITKLGPTKISCVHFFSIIPDTIGRLMDMLIEFIPIHQAYHSVKDIGLRQEFLVHFGPRAADCRVKNDQNSEEVIFWVDLVQKELQKAIDRERIWSRLTTSESIEVLEKDLAIFGFFIALGRSTQYFLSENGFSSIDEPVEGVVRYLIGGSVLYYPQLSSISSYQLYVEVVCEDLDWLQFYPGNSGTFKHAVHKKKEEGPPNPEAIPLALDVCFYWITSFIKYSKLPENPSQVKAARFLSAGHKKLKACLEELGIQKAASGTDSLSENDTNSFDKNRKRNQETIWQSVMRVDLPVVSLDHYLVDFWKILAKNLSRRKWTSHNRMCEKIEALESVEEALIRLEGLLQELHVSSSNSGREHLKAACSDLEKIRRLKKEAEFLEVSFRAKADSLQQEGVTSSSSPSSTNSKRQYAEDEEITSASENMGRNSRMRNPHALWSFLVRLPSKSNGPGISTTDRSEDKYLEQKIVSSVLPDSESNEIQRFELLRNELIELERRVQRSADQSEYAEDDILATDDTSSHKNVGGQTGLVQVQKKENIIEKSLDKLKETSTDVWQGTQLLAIDVAAAMGLLRRVIIGDELTYKEKQALRRTLTDLASVIPIGVLMLLPVTAVGHAAMLAAIQRYVPSLIPSTYGPERLDLLRQLQKVKEMKDEVNPSENAEEKPK